MADTHTSDARAGRLLADRYQLDFPIATGGMAQVWEATDEVLARKVAVKILHPHLAGDDSFVERFRREAVAAARLGHPSIVQIYDTCSEEGIEAIVMELVRGTTLRRRLDGRDGRTLDPAEAVSILAHVADALECAHRAGIVHRDVKPGNILLSDDGRVLVTDFGIAKAAEGPSAGDLTKTGMTIGTVRYFAPEQVDGGVIDARTDVYALGVVLYELLCGRPPFDGPTEAATALARLHRDPLRPRQVRAGVPRGLEAIVLRALARDPAQRYQSAADLRAALLAAGRDERLDTDLDFDDVDVTVARPAGPPTPPSGTPRFTQSERSWLLPTVVILLVAGALAVAGVLFSRTETVRDLFGSGDGGGTDTADDTQGIVVIGTATAFDPQGTGGENDDAAERAIDGDLSTAWPTETYNTRRLGGLKDGVGLVLTLDQTAELRELEVRSPTSDWAASVYLAEEAAADLDGWGAPIASLENIDGDATFELGDAAGRYVLVWITDLGDSPHRVEIAEVEVR
ncbi:MAG: protein kinase domain-containing protein [Acidimicrobiales bacterium]